VALSTKDEWWKEWRGRTVVCIASGPSLTAADCELVHAAAVPTIVTNTTIRLAPWADVLMGFDKAWWLAHTAELVDYAGRRVTCTNIRGKAGVQDLQKVIGFRGFGNSGCAAISLASLGRAARIVLLGFDVQHTGGRTHWHGDHPAGLGNAASVKMWPRLFAKAAQYAARHGSVVVNASRETALTCFPRVALEDELRLLHP
jgi:hypothetical protein